MSENACVFLYLCKTVFLFCFKLLSHCTNRKLEDRKHVRKRKKIFGERSLQSSLTENGAAALISKIQIIILEV